MKKIFFRVISLSVLALLTAANAYAVNPVSQEWVMQQISTKTRVLSAADWNAVCTSGTPTSASGCYGNVSSAAFTKVSNALGGFTSYANINPGNLPTSVFIKSFFGGTNTPISTSTLQVTLTSSAARCGLFTQAGYGLGVPGVNTASPASGNSGGGAPNNVGVVSINNTVSTEIYTNSNVGTLSTVAGAPNSNPLYLVCAGYSPADGSTAAALTVSAT